MNNNKWTSARTKQMPANMFSIMDAAIDEARQKKLELIDLSIGSSDLPAPEAAMQVLRQATRLSETHGYCLHSCTKPLRHAAAARLNKRYNLSLDAEKNILTLIGAQEGLGHLLFAVTDPGDLILVTDPGYPSYFGAIAIAGLEQVTMPLLEENMFLPDLTAIPS
ncbi:MAG: aminotransferase class I/II-fold pyridoxal phosphate-dependent enzyme, partial [Deltaproteobacteria bacterium]|nr:aminotransferase class I/II-fold pyridoxal phosphate-dependent enzyme [Deltaproteobacteria bacterium]